jgi:hypothetical protein
MVLPRILSQRDKDFDIAIWCEPHHDELFKALSPRIKVFHAKKETVEYRKSPENGKTYYYDFIDFEDLEGLEKYDIQIGLDSDDLIKDDYVDVIKHVISQENSNRSLHVCFQPRTFDVKTLLTRGMRQYNSKRGSAFMALYQPDKTNYRFIYCRSHITLYKVAEKSIILPEGHCWASIHWINESTGK